MVKRVSGEYKDLGSIPGPNNFLYFIFLQQIQCIVILNAHHTPPSSGHWIQHGTLSNAQTVRGHDAPSSQRCKELKADWA